MGDGFWQMEAHDEGESDRMGERGGESKHWTGTTTIHACVMYCPGTPILPELVQPSYTHVLLWYTHNLDWYTHQSSYTHTCCSGSDTPIHWSGTLLWYTQTANINSYSGILVHWTVALESYSALVQWKSSTAKSVPSWRQFETSSCNPSELTTTWLLIQATAHRPPLCAILILSGAFLEAWGNLRWEVHCVWDLENKKTCYSWKGLWRTLKEQVLHIFPGQFLSYIVR